MKTNRKYIILIVALLLTGIYGPSIYKHIKYGHGFENGVYRYMWLFKDSIRKNIDTTHVSTIGIVGKRDVLYNYNYSNPKNHIYYTFIDTVYYINIWELKDLKESDLKYDLIKQNTWLYDIKFKSYEIFNKDLDPTPEITAKLGFEFNNPKMDVNLDDSTIVYKTIDTTNCKGFYGKINKMSLSDAKGDHLILFKFKNPTKTLFMMYKTKQSFFVIYVNSNHEDLIDENIINMFNLKL